MNDRTNILNLVYVILPTLATGVLYATTTNSVSIAQVVLTFGLFLAASLSYEKWTRRQEHQLPVFAIIVFMHALFFCVSVFWGKRTSISLDSIEMSDESITGSLAMATVGMAGFLVGMRIGLARRVVPVPRLPDVPESLRGWWLVRFLAIVGIGSSLSGYRPGVFGEGWRQVVVTLLTFVPDVGFLLLWQMWLRKRASFADKVLLGVYLVARAAGGLAGGWLGGCIGIFILSGISYVRERRRLPLGTIALVIAIALFLQVGKQAFRERYWSSNNVDSTVPERVRFWLASSWETLSALERDPSVARFQEVFGSALVGRASLLSQAAIVYEKTPDIVPYQHGATYNYLVITLIPRLFWPDKPTVNDSNRFYQIEYGITRPEDINSVAIGAGLVPEAYMNFGWFGVFWIMLLIGIVLEVYQHFFLGQQSGKFASAVGLVLILPFMSIESQASVYLGGVLQHVGLTFLVFWPILSQDKFRQRTARRITVDTYRGLEPKAASPIHLSTSDI